MHQCQICYTRTRDMYRIDEYNVCETCLTQGRLDELPAFAVADDREATESGRTPIKSSWWNRNISAGTAR